MNFHVADSKRKSKKRKSPGPKQGFSFSLILKTVFGLLLMFMLMNYWITLRAKTEILNRKANQIRQRTEVLKQEIMHLRIEKEKLSSWKHISQNIRRFRLALISPEPYQVKKLYMIAKRSKKENKARELGANNKGDMQISANE